MASQTGKTTPDAASAPEETLTTGEVADAADTSPRGPAPDTSGRRVRAIPYQNGNRIKLSSADFKQRGGFDHPPVLWDQRVDNYTVAVGTGYNQISEQAAEFLTKNFKETFEYIDG